MASEQRFADDVGPGDEFEETFTLTTEHVQKFLDMPGNRLGSSQNRFNSAEAAKRDGLPGPIVPGVMSLDVACRIAGDFVGVQGKVRSVEVSFRRSVYHNDTLTSKILITDSGEDAGRHWFKADLFLENERGERPLQGILEMELPARG
ncbi:MAG: MaoC family dehydratase [Dehalococcoidia bacterium]